MNETMKKHLLRLKKDIFSTTWRVKNLKKNLLENVNYIKQDGAVLLMNIQDVLIKRINQLGEKGFVLSHF